MLESRRFGGRVRPCLHDECCGLFEVAASEPTQRIGIAGEHCIDERLVLRLHVAIAFDVDGKVPVAFCLGGELGPQRDQARAAARLNQSGVELIMPRYPVLVGPPFFQEPRGAPQSVRAGEHRGLPIFIASPDRPTQGERLNLTPQPRQVLEVADR